MSPLILYGCSRSPQPWCRRRWPVKHTSSFLGSHAAPLLSPASATVKLLFGSLHLSFIRTLRPPWMRAVGHLAPPTPPLPHGWGITRFTWSPRQDRPHVPGGKLGLRGPFGTAFALFASAAAVSGAPVPSAP